MKTTLLLLLILSASCSSKKSSGGSPAPEASDLVGQELTTVFHLDNDKGNLIDLSIYLKSDGTYEMSKRAISIASKQTVAGFVTVPAIEDQRTGHYTISAGQLTLEKPLWTSCDKTSGEIKLSVEKIDKGFQIAGDVKGVFLSKPVTNASYSILSPTKGKNREVKGVPGNDNLLTMYGCLGTSDGFTETSSAELVNTTK